MLDMVEAPRIAAVFVFNHRFERNIDKLENLYAKRFDHRFYLMPFSESTAPNVIRVVEASWLFGGHVWQGIRAIPVEDFTHLVFISDDLILNPELDQHNLLETLELPEDSGYIKSVASVDAARFRWAWASDASMMLRRYGRSFDWRELLPDAESARRRLASHGLIFPDNVRPRTVGEWKFAFRGLAKKSVWAYLMLALMRSRPSEYPLVYGYSDFFIVPANKARNFGRMCEVLSALNIFAEVTVPTALALSCAKLTTELPVNAHFVGSANLSRLPLRGEEMWSATEVEAFAKRFSAQTLAALSTEFPQDALYVHPVKLSQWDARS